jgi:hypothetical protein
MGEYADLIIDGLQCSGCGAMFQEAHGYPVFCHLCWDDMNAHERKHSGAQRATVLELGSERYEDLQPPPEPTR